MMSQTGRFAHITLAELLADKWLPTDAGQIEVGGLALDHRQLQAGDVFIAVPGTVHDGRVYIDAAISAGAVAVLKQADAQDETIVWRGRVPLIPFERLNEKISAIAAEFYGRPSTQAYVIGVTGTNGKSTCTHLLAQLNSRLGVSAAVMGTLGCGMVDASSYRLDNLRETGLTTADAIATQRILAELVESGAQSVAMEVSSHSLEQYRVAAVDFDVAVFTNLSRDHLDYHGDMASYARAKLRLFQFASLKHRIVNWDDEVGRRISGVAHPTAQTWTYSLSDPAAHIYVKKFTQDQNGMIAELESCWGKGTLRSTLIGKFNLSNLLAVVISGCVAGVSLEYVLETIAKLQPVAGRMEKVGGSDEINVVVDYAHTPDGLEKALSALREHTKGHLYCIFGCGGDRDKGKRPLMAAVAERWADYVVVTSDNPRGELPTEIIADIHQGFSNFSKVKEIEDRGAAISYCIQQAVQGDCVLIAGKGHENYQLIGDNRLPFSDIKHARLALRDRSGKRSTI